MTTGHEQQVEVLGPLVLEHRRTGEHRLQLLERRLQLGHAVLTACGVGFEAGLVHDGRAAARSGNGDVVTGLVEDGVRLDEFLRPEARGMAGAVLQRPMIGGADDEQDAGHGVSFRMNVEVAYPLRAGPTRGVTTIAGPTRDPAVV